MRKIRSCFRSPDVFAILSPSANSCSSATDFLFSSTISTGSNSGRLRVAANGGPPGDRGDGERRAEREREVGRDSTTARSEEGRLGRGKSKCAKLPIPSGGVKCEQSGSTSRWPRETQEWATPQRPTEVSGDGSECDVTKWATFDVGHQLGHEFRALRRLNGDDRILPKPGERSRLCREQRLCNGELIAQVRDGCQKRRVAPEPAESRAVAGEQDAHRVGLRGCCPCALDQRAA